MIYKSHLLLKTCGAHWIYFIVDFESKNLNLLENIGTEPIILQYEDAGKQIVVRTKFGRVTEALGRLIDPGLNNPIYMVRIGPPRGN